MKKVWNIVYIIAASSIIALLGLYQHAESVVKPNPMKVNYPQYERISQDIYADGK
jgi:hypothetical protein